ncbi:sugar transferase [Cytobacillus firmus]|uniref:sugar transferase n=1 Tax=Cytobacillus firmus TaxID=1399 RepID=UPI002162F2C3|nr:sugar transferase [Cytobacillus firmus]MCS0654756.1 sugar transferase [Cytobacillus firmus]MCU1807077.1 sugar transferase [Cytobacillus firmus]
MSKPSVRRRNKFIFLGIDLVSIILSYVMAFQIRFDQIAQRNIDSFISLTPWILLISLFFISVYELYNVQRRSRWDIIRDILVANTFIVFIIMAFSFFFRQFALPRTVIVIAYLISIGLMILWKLIYLKLKNANNIEKILVVGTNHNDMRYLVENLKKTFSNKARISTANVNHIESIEGLIRVNDMIAISPDINEKLKTKIIYESVSKNKTVYIVPSAYELILTRSNITSFEDSMVLTVKPLGLTLDQQLIKRVFDIVFSLISIIILSPIFLLAIILIKFESPKGSIFYGQKRMGRYNREFTIFKFRSMVEDAEKYTGPVLASSNDMRVTKIGKFLRATRIDELPQLFNVITGDMSIVGPRPEREHFIKEFEKKHESYKYRSTVKPGITGIAQVMGKYSTSVEDKLRYDLYYIRNYSLWLDILLLLRTVIVVLDKTKSEGTELKDNSKLKRKKLLS